MSSEHKVARIPKTNNFPLHITSFSPRHSTRPTILKFGNSQCNFLQTRVACFFHCASCQLVRRLGTFGHMQSAERGLSSVPKCRGMTNSSGNRSAPPLSQEAPASGRRGEGESEQVSSTPDAPGSAPEKTEGSGNKRLASQVPVTAAQSRAGNPFCTPAASHWPRWKLGPWRCKLKTPSTGRSPGGTVLHPRQTLDDGRSRGVAEGAA